MVVRPLEVIGEAANHVSSDIQNQYPEIEWGNMVGMRNRLIHGYTDVDWRIVWEVATLQIPILVQQLEDILSAES